MKKIKFNPNLALILYVFSFVGLFFLTIEYIDYKNILEKKEKFNEVTNATNIDENWRTTNDGNKSSPIYEYIVNDKVYYCNSEKIEGKRINYDKMNVYYDSNNPINCLTEYDNSYEINKLIVPIISLFLGLIPLFYKLIEKIRIKKLNKKGTLIKDLPYVICNRLKKTGKYYTKPIVTYIAPNGQSINLQSKAWFKIDDLQNFETLDLLIDLDNPDNYEIDKKV